MRTCLVILSVLETQTRSMPRSDLVLVVVVPFSIHNSLGCCIEPLLFAHGLELDALILTIALIFWSSVWGVPGAVLCVPITSIVHLALRDVRQPVAIAVVRLLEGKSVRILDADVQSLETKAK